MIRKFRYDLVGREIPEWRTVETSSICCLSCSLSLLAGAVAGPLALVLTAMLQAPPDDCTALRPIMAAAFFNLAPDLTALSIRSMIIFRCFRLWGRPRPPRSPGLFFSTPTVLPSLQGFVFSIDFLFQGSNTFGSIVLLFGLLFRESVLQAIEHL